MHSFTSDATTTVFGLFSICVSTSTIILCDNQEIEKIYQIQTTSQVVTLKLHIGGSPHSIARSLRGCVGGFATPTTMLNKPLLSL